MSDPNRNSSASDNRDPDHVEDEHANKRRKLDEKEDNPDINSKGDNFIKSKKKWGYEWFEEVLNRPRFICWPMVDQSEVAFRWLCLDYGTDVCYTPMLNSKGMVEGHNWVSN